MSISSIGSHKPNENYLDEVSPERQNTVQVNNNKTGRDALNHPTADVTKTAQTATDIVISSGKNLNQIVIENTVPGNESVKNIDKDTAINRNLGIATTTSATGTQSDENALPAEINAKNPF